jgi:hypothetical protein
MPEAQTAYTEKVMPRCGLLRWVSQQARPSALGGEAFALLTVGLVVWGLIDTRASGYLASEARQEAWKFVQPWITYCGDFHYITFSRRKTHRMPPVTYHIVQIQGFELQVTATPRHAVDLEWKGVVTSRAQAARVFSSEAGVWTPWSDWRQFDRVNVSVSLIKWDDQWDTGSRWEVEQYDIASLDNAHTALSCETVMQYLSRGGSRGHGTNHATIPQLWSINL